MTMFEQQPDKDESKYLNKDKSYIKLINDNKLKLQLL